MKKKIVGPISHYDLEGPIDDIIEFLKKYKETWGNVAIFMDYHHMYGIEIEVKPRD